jgi:hypothetical protein
MGYIRGYKKDFIDAISEPTMNEVSPPCFTVKVRGLLNDDLTLDFDKGTRKFVVVWDGEEEVRRRWLI